MDSIDMVNIIGIKKLKQKKYETLQGLPSEITRSFGDFSPCIRMLIWGESGNGKTSLMLRILKTLAPHGRTLYISLEEGHELSMQRNVRQQLPEIEHGIDFGDHTVTLGELRKLLDKQRSYQFVIIDSVQYWRIKEEQYFRLSKDYPRKGFVFLSHADGKRPKGSVADAIRYDAGIKIRVEGYIAFVISRYGGNLPLVVWEKGARTYWGGDYEKITKGLVAKPEKPAKTKTKPKAAHEEIPFDQPQL